MGHFRQIFLLIMSLIAALMGGGSVYAETSLDAKTILERCQKEGAVTIVDELTRRNNQEDWIEITDKIADGDDAWIKASACLMPGTHGSRSASDWTFLRIAWTAAIKKNPAAMLEIEYQGASIEDTCELPLYEPEEDFLAEYVAETLSALENVKQPHLQEGKERCIHMVKESYDDPDRCKYINDEWHCPASFCRKDPDNIYCKQ